MRHGFALREGVCVAVEKRLSKALERVATSYNVIIEEVRILRGAAPTVEVTVDSPRGIADAPCAHLLAEISHEIAQIVEGRGIMSGSYNVNVSSPGAERKLVEDRHWEKAVGRLVRLTLAEEEDIVARLDRFDAPARQIVIRQKKLPRKGLPPRYHAARALPLKEIKQACGQAEF